MVTEKDKKVQPEKAPDVPLNEDQKKRAEVMAEIQRAQNEAAALKKQLDELQQAKEARQRDLDALNAPKGPQREPFTQIDYQANGASIYAKVVPGMGTLIVVANHPAWMPRIDINDNKFVPMK